MFLSVCSLLHRSEAEVVVLVVELLVLLLVLAAKVCAVVQS